MEEIGYVNPFWFLLVLVGLAMMVISLHWTIKIPLPIIAIIIFIIGLQGHKIEREPDYKSFVYYGDPYVGYQRTIYNKETGEPLTEEIATKVYKKTGT